MLSATNSPIPFLNRPFFDLGPSNGGSLRLYDVEFSYRHLDDTHMGHYGLQVTLSPSFRTSLIHQSALPEYKVVDPLQLPDHLRTERWQDLCECLACYQHVTPTAQLRLINVLKSLCFHQAIRKYVPKMAGWEIARDPVLAALSLRRAMSKLVLRLEAGLPYNRDDFEVIAREAPSGSVAKISAALQIVAQDGKLKRDLAGIQFWADVAAEEMRHVNPPLDAFGHGLLTSIFHRAVAFIPLLQNDKDELIRRMNECEEHAKNLPCKDEEQRIAGFEAETVCLQSRAKEALWLGDFDLAEERARELVAHDRWDSLYLIELGDILLKQQKIEEAAQAYHAASRLGPPRSEYAFFMAGQCEEVLGDLDRACDCYLACITVDPWAICAMEKIHQLAPRLASPGITEWSRVRLAELREQKQHHAAGTISP